MGIIIEYFPASSIEAAVELIDSPTFYDHVWNSEFWDLDPFTDLAALWSAVTGASMAAEGEPTTFELEVGEAGICSLSPHLLAALAGLEPERISQVVRALADEFDLDFGGHAAHAVREFAEFCARSVASGDQVFVLMSP